MVLEFSVEMNARLNAIVVYGVSGRGSSVSNVGIDESGDDISFFASDTREGKDSDVFCRVIKVLLAIRGRKSRVHRIGRVDLSEFRAHRGQIVMVPVGRRP